MVEKLREKGAVYRFTQVKMAQSSLRINGERVTIEEVEEVFDGKRHDEYIENHFKLFDLMLDTYEEPVTEELLVSYDEALGFNGERRTRDKVVDKVAGCVPAESIDSAMTALFKMRLAKFSDVIKFIVELEHIRPFESGSSEIARMIAYKECLRLGLDPVVISAGKKMPEYVTGLSRFEKDTASFMKYMRQSRLAYKKAVENFSEN